MKFDRVIVYVLLLFIVISCDYDSGKGPDVSGIEIDEVSIKRYGKAIFNLDEKDLGSELKRIKPEFPLFLDGDLDDPETIDRMKGFILDPSLQDTYDDCIEYYPDLTWLKEELEKVFRLYKYYFPDEVVPIVYTYVSGFDYEYRTQFYNDNLVIALDMYLGADYESYQQLGLPKYILEKFAKENITRDAAYEIARSKTNYRAIGNKMLDQMIAEGKLLYFVKALMPGLDDEVLFGYTEPQLEWAHDNEGMIWAFMIENEVLYSSDLNYQQKFIQDGPFTSYFGNESPTRLGAFIGYKIVESYMGNQKDFGLKELFKENDTQKILKTSKYKPN